jgi:hypothetical protein
MIIDLRNSLRLPDYMQGVEEVLRLPLLFTLIYVFGGIFAGLHYPYPKYLFELFEKYSLMRFFGILCLAFTATGQVEYAIGGTLIFFFMVNIMRNDEERIKYPYGI